MAIPAGYTQLASGFWIKSDGSGPYFIDATSGAVTPVAGATSGFESDVSPLLIGMGNSIMAQSLPTTSGGALYSTSTGESTLPWLDALMGCFDRPLIAPVALNPAQAPAVFMINGVYGHGGAVWSGTIENAVDNMIASVQAVRSPGQSVYCDIIGTENDMSITVGAKLASEVMASLRVSISKMLAVGWTPIVNTPLPFTMSKGQKIFFGAQPAPGNTLTVTIDGTAVVFTFVSTIGAAPGNVLIGATPTNTATNLATLINLSNTTTATGVAFSGGTLTAIQKMLSYTSGATITMRARQAAVPADITYGAAGDGSGILSSYVFTSPLITVQDQTREWWALRELILAEGRSTPGIVTPDIGMAYINGDVTSPVPLAGYNIASDGPLGVHPNTKACILIAKTQRDALVAKGVKVGYVAKGKGSAVTANLNPLVTGTGGSRLDDSQCDPASNLVPTSWRPYLPTDWAPPAWNGVSLVVAAGVTIGAYDRRLGAIAQEVEGSRAYPHIRTQVPAVNFTSFGGSVIGMTASTILSSGSYTGRKVRGVCDVEVVSGGTWIRSVHSFWIQVNAGNFVTCATHQTGHANIGDLLVGERLVFKSLPFVVPASSSLALFTIGGIVPQVANYTSGAVVGETIVRYANIELLA